MPSVIASRVTWMVLALQLVVGTFVVSARDAFKSSRAHHSTVSALDQTLEQVALSESENRDQAVRQRLVGVWQDEYQGHRTLTIRPDGTATMVMELRGLHRLFAQKLTFEEEWTLEGDQLQFHLVGGEPATKIDFVIELKGTHFKQKILELSKSRLLVWDDCEQVEMDWQRVSPASLRPAELARK